MISFKGIISFKRTKVYIQRMCSVPVNGPAKHICLLVLFCLAQAGWAYGQDRSPVQLEAQVQEFQVVDPEESVKKRVSPVLVGRAADFESYEVDALPVEFKYEEPATNNEVMLQPVIHPFKKLRYDEEGEGFSGGIMVFLENRSAPGMVDDLSSPITVWFSGEVETITPEIVTIEQTNTPIFVAIQDDSPRDSIRIEVSTALDGARYPTYLGVLPELIPLDPEKEIQGGGFEVSGLEVQLRGLTITEATTVQFSLEDGKGYIDPNVVTLSNGEHTARATIRSEGWDAATVNAYIAGVGNAKFDLTYVFPISFFAFTLIGGLLGGLIRGVDQGKKVWQVMLSGLPPALLIVMLYFVLRINVVSDYIPVVDAYNEATVCIVAAVAALFGAKRIHALFATKKTKGIPA